MKKEKPKRGTKNKATVTFTVKNTGTVAGPEVTQVYVKQQKSALPRLEKELKGFEKIMLQPGQQKVVPLTLNEDAFKYFNDLTNKWVFKKGVFNILVGSSSGAIQVNTKITV